MSANPTGPNPVGPHPVGPRPVEHIQRSELQLGELLAEGGEGRVFDVMEGPIQPGQQRLYKELRRPFPVSELSSLVAFPSLLASRDAGLSARVVSSSAWPVAVVVGDDPAVALGTVMPRAPDGFWVRHRDGTNRLASLSYLANDPDRIAVAYGVMMPAPGAPERVALVYALARLLDAWQAGPAGPQVVHGDLSAKNVLWSLEPAPAVYVLDCDGAMVTNGEGDDDAGPAEEDRPVPAQVDEVKRHRATTLNWGDPAVRHGGQPTGLSDRYLLAITFLRVVGAAHFPIQGRQKTGQKLNVDLELPRSWRKLPDMPGLWELCERSLSLVNAADRPAPAEWVNHLEELLGALSAGELARAARQAQCDLRPGASSNGDSGAGLAHERPIGTTPDVVVRPVLRHRAPSTWQLISAAPPLGVGGEVLSGVSTGPRGRSTGSRIVGLGVAGLGRVPVGVAGPAPLSARQMVARVIVLWGGAHRVAARWARSPGRRAYGLRRLAGVLVVDVAVACVAVFVLAMIISPWIGL
jgi:Phosphotransferase enzyme family